MRDFKITFGVFLAFVFNTLQAQNSSPFIHVDQFGYLPSAVKVAVISNPMEGYNSNLNYSPGSSMRVVNANTGEVVLSESPVVWNGGATHQQSGDKGWWFDFSSITEEGEYYIEDLSNNEQSATFMISESVYADIIKAAGRMFYYNRCNMAKEARFAGAWADATSFGNALQDANCRYIYDRGNGNLEKDLSGGWFDAGDYNKYITFANNALHNMLSAYEENPLAFSDNWNIPESGNGIPDIIDEIKWELDWMMKMANSDGSVHIKMGSQNHSENIASPPSANIDQRFYGPTCSSASITLASVFAHASKVFDQFSSFSNYADQLQGMAKQSFEYSRSYVDNNSFETGCDDGSIIAGDADQTGELQMANFITAAIYLYEQTGEAMYHDYIINNVNGLEQIETGFWGPYTIEVNDALMLYASLDIADDNTADLISGSFSSAVSNDWNDFFGFSENDLYRAAMPDWSYHWGSNQVKASYGIINSLALKMDVESSSSDSFEQYMQEAVHYFHGVNPQGVVYLSNMYSFGAEKSVDEIYHTWFYDGTEYDHSKTSAIGPAPGFLSGGANKNFSVSTLTPPSGQPAQKSYLDFNAGFPENSWEISEPAIYYQAAYIRLLANNVTQDQVLAIGDEISESFHGQMAYPNPTTGKVQFDYNQVIERIEIYSTLGKKVLNFDGPSHVADLSILPNGIYFAVINQDQIYKIIKE